MHGLSCSCDHVNGHHSPVWVRRDGTCVVGRPGCGQPAVQTLRGRPAQPYNPTKRTFNHSDGHHKHTRATARRNPNHLAPCTPQRCGQKCEIVWVCLGVSTHHMSPLPRTRFTAGVMGATQRRLIGFGSLFDAQHRNPDAKQGRGREIRQHTRGRVCNQTTIFRCFLSVFGLQTGVFKPSKTSGLN